MVTATLIAAVVQIGVILVIGRISEKIGPGKMTFIGCLVTLDAEALPGWLETKGRPTDTPLAQLVDDPEVHGLLALMLLHHARRRSRTRPDGSIVPLADQDRGQWDTGLIAKGIDIAHAALARDQLGEYQAQAAIAALHADAPRVEETDWVQIVEWYDELLRLADTPIVRLNRAVAVGEASGPTAGLRALAEVDEGIPRRDAVAERSISARERPA